MRPAFYKRFHAFVFREICVSRGGPQPHSPQHQAREAWEFSHFPKALARLVLRHAATARKTADRHSWSSHRCAHGSQVAEHHVRSCSPNVCTNGIARRRGPCSWCARTPRVRESSTSANVRVFVRTTAIRGIEPAAARFMMNDLTGMP